MAEQAYDYSKGQPRRHHDFYIEDGNITMQAENAIFRVHRFHLAQRSSVMSDMFRAPEQKECQDGTDFKPLVLPGDSAAGWEVLFRSIYSTKLLKSELNFTNDELFALLRIANKYCMESTEEEIVSHFQTPSNKEGFIQLLEASQIVGSKSLWEKAIQGLLPHKGGFTLEEARRIKIEAFHTIVMSPQRQTSPAWAQRVRGHVSVSAFCIHCGISLPGVPFDGYCQSCRI